MGEKTMTVKINGRSRDMKKLANAARDAKDKFSDVEQTVEKYAKTHPWKSLGVSLLAGVLVGKLFR
jgi:ElaB/YqjD/DUF883 family membrane-anchored ribosome-binding protein